MIALAIAITTSTALIAITPRAWPLEEGNVSWALMPIAETTTAHAASSRPQT